MVTHQAVGILGTGSYLPKLEVTNEEIAKRVGVTAEWIERKTQIRTRRYAAPTEATSDLAARAVSAALSRSGCSVADIDYLIVSTSTGDSPQPPTAHLVQDALMAKGAACFDINVVCSGFVYGLVLAQGLLALNPGAHAVVVAADVYSRILDYTDRSTAVLFADGAGAAVVGAVPPSYGIIDASLRSRGDAHQLIGIEAGGSRVPPTHETVDAGAHFFTMRGRDVSDFVLENLPPALNALLARAGVEKRLVDHFVPHQPNGNLLDALVKESGLTGSRTHRSLERYGNLGSASIPVTLDEANRSGSIRQGDLVLLAGFGGGMSIGASLLRWSCE